MIHLSAFADEISPELGEQIETLQREDIHYVELRAVWDTNVLDLTDEQVERILRAFARADIRVSAIASPLGKVPVDSPAEEQLPRFDRAIALARAFQASYIRLFSFYPPRSALHADPSEYREAVFAHFRAMLSRLSRDADAARRITLVHENEKDIYGDTVARCVDLLAGLDDPRLAAAFDPANFIQCGQTPFPDAYEALQPWIRYVHVKDARADGSVTVAGEGESRWPDLLARLHADGYDGFLALEPHLAGAGQYSGFSGPILFRTASQALKHLLQEMDWEYQ